MGQRRALSDEELALWQEVAAGAKPLKRKRKGKHKVKRPADRPAPLPRPVPDSPPPKPNAAKPNAVEAVAPSASSTRKQAKPEISGGIDKNQAARLSRGQLPIEGRIDLHGRTQAEAHDALCAFLLRAANAGKRCLLVITGKGRAPEGAHLRDRGVLKTNVPRWLSEPGLKRLILATRTARPEHGGDGALYVLLKRKR